MQGALVASETHKNALKEEKGRKKEYQPHGFTVNQTYGGILISARVCGPHRPLFLEICLPGKVLMGHGGGLSFISMMVEAETLLFCLSSMEGGLSDAKNMPLIIF